MARLAIPHAGEPSNGRSGGRRLLGVLRPWRGEVAVVGVLVLAAAVFEVVPPLIIRNIVDAHLRVHDPDGLFTEALLYLGAVAAMQGVTFLYGYLAAAVAQAI